MWWWTVQNLLIAAAVAGLVRVACRAGRIGPVGRHALWLVVLVKLLTPPMVVWPWAVRAPLGTTAPPAPAPEMRHVAAASAPPTTGHLLDSISLLADAE